MTSAILLAALAAGVLLTRYGVQTQVGRQLLESQADGLKLGRFGRLGVEGLTGDPWRDFRLRQLTLSDEEGPWLRARDVHVVWSYPQLLRRRLVADEVTIGHAAVLRRPTLGAKTTSKGLPISFDIRQLQARVETLPAFSSERGLFDVSASIHVGRGQGGQSGQISAASLLRPGDRLDVAFNLGGGAPLRIDGEVREASGGPIAGALGLPTGQPFAMAVDAHGRDGGGRFEVLAMVGKLTPLRTSGAWSERGLRAQGTASLTASSLTRELAARLGPELSFKLTTGQAVGGLRMLDLDAAARNLDLQVAGPLDVGARRAGPRGLQVSLRAPDGSPLIPGAEAGPVEFSGRVFGGLADFRLQGRAAASELAAGGYALDRFGGPISLARNAGDLSLEADLAGTGGRGSGALSAVLGRSPAVQVAASRLQDGRMLISRLTARGAGLDLTGRGGRGPTGGLAFSGRVQISRLGGFRPGASGAVTGSWRARQGDAESPWRLELDARGESLSTGFAELDRLLGPRPRLTAKARLPRRGSATLQSAVLHGAKARLQAAGLIGGPAGLRVKLDWRASGPFGVGPIEIVGHARGSGAVTGAMDGPTIDLLAHAPKVNVPRLPLTGARMVLRLQLAERQRDGVVVVTGQTPYGPARARADLDFPPGGLRLSGLQVDGAGVHARGSLAFAEGGPTAADLRLQIGPGALLSGGRASGNATVARNGGQSYGKLDLALQNAQLRGAPVVVTEGQIRADGPLSRLTYQARAAGRSGSRNWLISGEGRMRETSEGRLVTFSGQGTIAGETLRTLQPATLRFGPDERTLTLRLGTEQGGRISADGALSGASLKAQAELQQIAISMINPDLTGRIEGRLRLHGRGDDLQGSLTARLDDVFAAGAEQGQALDGVLQGRIAGDTARIQANFSNAQGLAARAAVAIPIVASASPLRLSIHRRQPMAGEITARGEIAPLWNLLVGGDRLLAGRANLSARLGGTLSDPRLTGQAAVDGGRFEDGATGLLLRDTTVRAAFNQDVVQVSQLTGRGAGGGTLRGSGRISLLRSGPSSFRLQLRDFRLVDTELVRASASGQATVARAGDGKITVLGVLSIDEAEISASHLQAASVPTLEVREINKPPGVGRQDAPTPPVGTRAGVALDVGLRAPGRVFVRGRGLDVELSMTARVSGTTSNPRLTGQARVVRGDYAFAGQRFVFDQDSVVHLATTPEDIRLDLTATREDPALTAVVHIAGTAAKPEIRLSSSPALPEDEILARVLFGESASQLSGVEAARLAAALSSLQGGGGFDVFGQLRGLTGLDRLAIIGAGGSNFGFAAGKYLSDDVYLNVIGGGPDGPVVQGDWRVARGLSILSTFAGQGGSELAVRWRRSY